MEVKEFLEKDSFDFSDLCEIMRILRAENGCPWDREQDHKSIRNNFLEEAYEAIEGIDSGDDAILKEELGDVLLQVVFHAQIAKEEGSFDINEVADGVCKKLILRHPHIFSNVNAETSEQVLKNWDEIKKKEKHQKSHTDTLRSVSVAMPSLQRASKIQSKAAKCGFTYKDASAALEKADEEFNELKEAVVTGDNEKIQEEIGDILFAFANVARLLEVNAEESLYLANEKFIRRFALMESAVTKEKRDLCELSVNEMLAFWEKMKNL